MRYCSLADLQLAIPPQTLIWLSNDDESATAMNQAVVEEAVRQAEELVDAHLRGRYNLPLDPVPSVVKDMTVNLARHWLYARRPEGSELPDAVTRTYKSALQMLEGTSADTVKVTRRAPNKASAEAQAKAELDRRLLERTSGEISLEGDPVLAAGANIELYGFGKLSGLYTITRATHAIVRNAGYTTSLELKRAAPPASATKATPAKPKGLKVYGMKDGQVQVVDTTAKKGKK